MKKNEKILEPKDLMNVNRPVLGDKIPISLWRLLRLVAMPKAFGEKTTELDYKLGYEMGNLLSVKKPKDLVKAINDAQIGICNPLEHKDQNFAIEFTECFTCSGIYPPVGKAICDFEVALVVGAFEKMGYKVKKSAETKCMGGLGDDVCRVEIEIQK